MYRWIFVGLLVCSAPVFANSAQWTQATADFYRGHFATALQTWQTLRRNTTDRQQQVALTLASAAAQRQLGLYQACRVLLDSLLAPANTLALTEAERALLWIEASRLNLVAGRDYRSVALTQAAQAVETAQRSADGWVLAAAHNLRANTLVLDGRKAEALDSYRLALHALPAGPAPYPLLADLSAKIKVNTAKAWLELPSTPDNAAALTAAFDAAVAAAQAPWQDRYNQIFALIALAKPHPNHTTPSHLDLLELALQQAKQLDNASALSQVYGELGAAHEQAQHYAIALAYTRQASFFAQSPAEAAIRYRWYWQQGRLLHQLGRASAAIVAYDLAIQALNPIRESLLKTGYDAQSRSFREHIGPVYFEMVDVLLQQAPQAEPAESQRLRLKARDIIEQYKAAQLHDYFDSPCLRHQTRACQPFAPGQQTSKIRSAILYPIPLPDRLVTLLSLPDGTLHQITSPISADELRFHIEQLLAPLRQEQHLSPARRDASAATATADSCDFQSRSATNTVPSGDLPPVFYQAAKQLYAHLISPLQAQLHAQAIDTLVIVPEGALRSLPFAALYHDGHYLVEEYALAISPGLCLELPASTPNSAQNILLAGVSEGDDTLKPLPCAKAELEHLAQLFHVHRPPLLLNQDFTRDNFQNHLQARHYDIVHIASHGEFRAESAENYILIHRHKLGLQALNQLLRMDNLLKEDPIDLLVLSACETASSDENEQAGLGLAGVALSAGVRNALASLWKIDDRATPALILAFYQALQQPGMSKARALQQAQRTLLQDPQYQHPYYWAAFVLIGSGR